MSRTKKNTKKPEWLPVTEKVFESFTYNDLPALHESFKDGDTLALKVVVRLCEMELTPLPFWASDALGEILDCVIEDRTINTAGRTGGASTRIENAHVHYLRYAMVQAWRAMGASLEKACFHVSNQLKNADSWGDPRTVRQSYDLFRKNLKRNKNFFLTAQRRNSGYPSWDEGFQQDED